MIHRIVVELNSEIFILIILCIIVRNRFLFMYPYSQEDLNLWFFEVVKVINFTLVNSNVYFLASVSVHKF